jgi:hypothetical protein
MADTRKIVKVFLASPGDLGAERRAAKAAVDEFNDHYADVFGYQVELIGWEDTVSVFGRPQATINRDLESCELFVGLLWKKWGTSPAIDGPYTSGFEEEFEQSIDRRRRQGRPEISLFFKEIADEFLRDPGEQLQKVIAFKDRLIRGKLLLFEEFVPEAFDTKFRRCISAYVTKLFQQERDRGAEAGQAPKSDGSSRASDETNEAASATPFSIEGATFLREFIAQKGDRADSAPAVDIARFRLLSTLISYQGNDEPSLGVHDANLLFAARGNTRFGERELRGLLAIGLDHYVSNNVPLWHWLLIAEGYKHHLLALHSLLSTSTRRRVGALSAMRLISEPLTSTEPERQEYLDSWFAQDASHELRAAALAFLAECGTSTDLPVIQNEAIKADHSTLTAAVDAILRINLRDSRRKAISVLYEMQPTSISHSVLAAIFDNGAALDVEVLKEGLAHRSPEVRRVVAALLFERDAMPPDIAEPLLNDGSAAVRYTALRALVASGRVFSDDDAKAVLLKRATTETLGAWFTRHGASTGEELWSAFREQRLVALSDKELESAAVQGSVFSREASLVLTERHFARRSHELRKAVDDNFKDDYAQAFQRLAETLKGQDELLEKIGNLEEDLRKEFTRQGLDVICRTRKCADLNRVRAAMRSGVPGPSPLDIDYLRVCGEWEDIELILETVRGPLFGRGKRTLLADDDEDRHRTAARAIYALARTRLAEAIVLPAPSQVTIYLILQTSEKAFRGLDDVIVDTLLQSEHDEVRKMSAMKCVQVWPRTRLAKYFAAYMARDRVRYYNVVHWLDFGLSAPRDRAIVAAKKVLNERGKR